MKHQCFRRITAVLLLAAALSALCSCGEKKPDISAYGDTSVAISGLLDERFTVTPNELMKLDCTAASAEGEGSGNTVKAAEAYGPTLQAFVEHYGKSLKDFYSIRFIASDGYAVTIAAKTWDKYTVILSVANGAEAPLDADQQPLRMVSLGGESGAWVRMVTEIEFTYK